MNNLTLLIEKYINHCNQCIFSTIKIDTLKSMTQANSIACKSITSEFQDAKVAKQMLDKQQDKLVTSLEQIDKVQSDLNQVQSCMTQMQSTIKRIKSKISDYQKLRK